MIYIRDNAFDSCVNLENIQLPNDLEFVGKYSYANCTNLKEVILPKNIDTITTGLFDGCTSLTRINLEDVTYIDRESFRKCSSLNDIKLGDKLEMISCEAFKQCNNIKEITIPKSVKNILSEAFAGCEQLEKVEILSSDVKILEDVFVNCPNIKIYCYSGSTAEQYAIDNKIEYELIGDENNNKTIKFKDEALYNFMKEYLNNRYKIIEDNNDEKKEIVIKEENLLKVDLINMEGKGISDLSGLDSFTNLTHLYANNNNIKDLSPISELTNLHFLILNNNKIENINDLEKLINITELQLDGNSIMNISILSKLTKLDRVFLMENSSQINIEKVQQGEMKEIELPNIFINSKTEGSKIYTSNNLKLINCNIKSDKILLNTDNLGENIATITIDEGKANKTSYKIEYTVEKEPVLEDTEKPTIEITVFEEENIKKIKIKATDETAMKHIIYRWNTEEETKVEVAREGDTVIEKNIEIQRGQNTLTIVAVDSSNNTETIEKSFLAKNIPVIDVGVDKSKLIIKITHDMGFKKVEISLNDKIYTYDENSSEFDLTQETLEYAFELKEGKNRIAIIATSMEDTEKTYVGETTYNLPKEKTLTKIEISKQPIKTTYEAGEKFDPTGMEVVATYSDGSKKNVTKYYVLKKELSMTDTSLEVTYSEGEITKTTQLKLTVIDNTTSPVIHPNAGKQTVNIIANIMIIIMGIVAIIKYKIIGI